MLHKKSVIQLATVGALAFGLSTAHANEHKKAHDAGHKGMEKCYGIAKAGHKDCGTSHHACAGHAKGDHEAHDWKWVKHGECEKMHGKMHAPKK